MNNINFLSRPSFPLSSDTMNFMLEMIKELGQLTALGGKNYILSGCEVLGSNVNEGYIVVDGELLPFKAGTLSETFVIVENNTDIVALGETYPEVRTEKHARFGSGSIQYKWKDLRRISDLLTLKDDITELKKVVGYINTVPRGMVSMFAGSTEKVPVGWSLCDGSLLDIDTYPELYAILGKIHGGNSTQFRLPDLRGRFVVSYGQATGLSYSDLKPNYNIGQKGGENTHQMTESEMPRHRHVYSDDMNAHNNFNWENKKFPEAAAKEQGNTSAKGAGTGRLFYTDYKGGYDRHENRPPYYVLAYIIKI